MPLIEGKDMKGNFFKWGDHGKKYYFDPLSSRSKKTAITHAKKQALAIILNKRFEKYYT